MRKVYLLLTATNTYFARFIRFYSKKPYSHASISFDKKCRTSYSFGRTYVNNPFVGSFQRESIDKGVFGKCPHIPCEILELEVTEEQYNTLKSIIDTMDGRKYNKLGLLLKMLNISYERKTKFFCSEFVAYALRESNIYKFNKPLNFIEPCDFLEIPIVHTIYQGDFKQQKRD